VREIEAGVMDPQHPALGPGKLAVITGAASGIGLAAARRLAAFGMRVCLADRDESRLAEACAALGGADVQRVSRRRERPG
jgi:NADP-dependent 3-hydroxy acid dehydrogenase YdfG